MKSTTHPIEPEEVMAYLDGELVAERTAAVGAHIEQCAECAALATELRGISARMADWPVEPVPASLNSGALAEKTGHPQKLYSSLNPWRKRIFGVSQWAWGLAGGLAVILVVAAISLPNLLRARITANETSAVGSLRTIVTACVQYFSSYGGYPRSLEQLGPGTPPSEDAADLIDAALASGTKSGYQFIYTPGTTDARGKVQDYTVTAEPVQRGESGFREFFADESGAIRQSADGPATAGSQALWSMEPQGGATEALSRPVAGNSGGGLPLSSTEKAPNNVVSGPMIIRTASLAILSREFDNARAAMEEILRSHNSYAAHLTVNSHPGRGRTLNASVRVPTKNVEIVLAELKKLGRVVQESQSGEEITQTYVDLVARQENGRHIEQRLVEVLRSRTGKVKEVLEVEQEIARVREEIERMEAQRKSLENQVQYATVTLELREEFEKQIEVTPPSTGTLLWNATVDGYDSAVQTVLALALFLLRAGPSLLLWAALLFLPARLVWRRMRAATAQ